MKLLSSAFYLLAASLCLGSCVGTMAPERPNDSSNLLRGLKFVAEIPVVRPSTRNAAELTASAIDLVKRHQRSNVVAYRVDGAPRLSTVPVADEAWLKYVRAARWEVEGWDFDPGTTAHVYLGRAWGAGSPYNGKIVFVKNGEVLGFRAVGGRRNLFGYYRDMARLGIYIP